MFSRPLSSLCDFKKSITGTYFVNIQKIQFCGSFLFYCFLKKVFLCMSRKDFAFFWVDRKAFARAFYLSVNKQPKGIKWSAVPLPALLSPWFFMGEAGQRPPMGDKVLQNGEIFCSSVLSLGHPTKPEAQPANPEA